MVRTKIQTAFRPTAVPKRDGVTVLEVIASAAVLFTAMTITTTMFFNVDKIWKDVRYRQMAVCELNSQLDSLTRLDFDNAKIALEKLEVSEICDSVLREPILAGTLDRADPLGTRITLTIKYKKGYSEKVISLSGWLNPAFENSEPEDLP